MTRARKKRSLIQRIQLATNAFVRELVTPMAVSGQGPFKGAEFNRLFFDWMASVMSPDDETKASLRTLRARARDLARNNGLAIHYLELLETNVVGPNGFTLVAQIRNAAGELLPTVNKKLEGAWNYWTQSPATLDEQVDWIGLQNLVLRTVAIDGECFLRFWRGAENPWGFAFEMIDADLVDEQLNEAAKDGKNEIRQGVEIDAQGRRVGYWILRDPAYGRAARVERVRIPADQIAHVFIQRRPNQTRGVTWFTGAMWPMRQEQGYIEAELVASRAGACKVMNYYATGTEPGTIDPPAAGDTDESGNPVQGGGEFRETIEPMMATVTPVGYRAEMLDPTHPTTAFPEFIKAIGRRIATALSVSYNILMNDLEGVSFSSIRSWTISERDVWKKLQGWWRFAVLRRSFNEWLDWVVLTGRVNLGSRDANLYRSVKHVGRGWDWVDPVADVDSVIKGIQNLLTSPQRVCAERGLDFDEVLDEIAEARRLAEEKGVPFGQVVPGPPPASTAAAPGAETPQKSGRGGRLSHLLKDPEDKNPVPELQLVLSTNGKH